MVTKFRKRHDYVTKKHPQDARELKVHTAGESDALVQLTLKTAGEQACERTK